jgi:hypothetical protein
LRKPSSWMSPPQCHIAAPGLTSEGSQMGIVRDRRFDHTPRVMRRQSPTT